MCASASHPMQHLFGKMTMMEEKMIGKWIILGEKVIAVHIHTFLFLEPTLPREIRPCHCVCGISYVSPPSYDKNSKSPIWNI
jgi:hypothetical protein